MALIFKKNSVDVTSSIDMPTLSLLLVLTNEISTLEFSIKKYGTKTSVTLGDQIDLYEDSVHIFGGTVVEASNEIESGILRNIKYIANDWSFRLNSKLVQQTYTDMDAKDIVLDIMSNFTDGTFTTTNVETAGFNIPTIQFNYEQVTITLQKLAKMIGWEWYVDPDKDLHFFPPDTTSNAPYTIDDTSGNLEWPTLAIKNDIINLKNSIYVIGGTYTKAYTSITTPDTYTTDGTQNVFYLAYAYDPDTIVVTLAGVSQTIGTDQVTADASVQVQYNKTSRFIRFTSTPATTQNVKIYGNALIPILANASNSTSITTYGTVEDVIIDEKITSVAEAHQRANAELALYSTPVNVVKFATTRTGFQVGQTVRINSTIFATDIYVIIKRIVGRPYSPTSMRYEIECVGTEQVSFLDIMKFLLMQAATRTEVADSTVLETLLLLNEAVTITETLHAPTSTSGAYKWGADANAKAWNFFTWG